MTLAIYTRATEGLQDSTTTALEETFFDPAVDTSLKRGLSSTAGTLTFSAICRTFRSGGTRIRTGDTMIFSHMQKPLGMRKTRIGKRIYVQGVPLDTTWFCPYCCATVDMPSVTPRSAGSRMRTSAPSLIPQRLVYRAATTTRRVRAASSLSLSLLAKALSESRSRSPHTTSRRSRKWRASEPIRHTDLLITSVRSVVAGVCRFGISKGFSVPCIAHYCRVLRPGQGQTRVKWCRKSMDCAPPVPSAAIERHVAKSVRLALEADLQGATNY
jgi:hypothetical protein